MYNSIDKVMQNLEILRSFHQSGISYMLNTAKEIKSAIKSINLKLDDLTLKNNEFKPIIALPIYGDDYDKDGKESIFIKGVEGSSYTNAGSSCYAIKKKFAFKLSGYYWIRSHC